MKTSDSNKQKYDSCISEVFSKDSNTKTNRNGSGVNPPQKNKEEKKSDKKE